MSQEEQRRRVPTSDELERQGALAPATGEPQAGRRSGLRRFFRASRYRVSDDVAARKHVGTWRAPSPGAAPAAADQGAAASRNPDPATAAPASRQSAVPEARRPADAIVPRTIRMDPSVKDRRGLGRNRPR
jgi:hypothetical protein